VHNFCAWAIADCESFWLPAKDDEDKMEEGW
jgi:hypothetical protein